MARREQVRDWLPGRAQGRGVAEAPRVAEAPGGWVGFFLVRGPPALRVEGLFFFFFRERGGEREREARVEFWKGHFSPPSSKQEKKKKLNNEKNQTLTFQSSLSLRGSLTSSRSRRLVAPAAERDAGSRKPRTWCRAPSSRDAIGGAIGAEEEEGEEVEVPADGGSGAEGFEEEDCSCRRSTASSSQSLSSPT